MYLFPTRNLKVILQLYIAKHLLTSELICAFKNIVIRKNNTAINIMQSLAKSSGMGKRGIFIPSHSHHHIAIPMKLE